jgi:hypothetical protein
METVTTETPAVVIPPADNGAEIAALRSELAETKRAAEFWSTRATQASAPPPAAAKEEAAEEEVDLLDVLSTQGVKGFNKVLKSLGYASKAEVDAAVNSKAAQLSAEAELIDSYPDLRKRDSEFFRATAEAYGNLKKQGVPEALAMKLGAQQAELDGYKSGKTKTVGQTAAEKESARLARIKAQGGDRGSRVAVTEDDDDELNDDNQAAIRQLADALDISVEDATKRYVARAKMGTNVALKLDRKGR